MTESLITQQWLDVHGGAIDRRTPHGMIFKGGNRKKKAILRNHPVHVLSNGQIVPIDTRWKVGTGGEYGVETLAPRIYPASNEIHFDGCSFCFQPYAVGTVTLDPLGFDLIATLPTGNLIGNQYIIEIGAYTYTLTLHEKNRVKVDIELPEKPPGLSGDYFVIANKVLDPDFFKDVILEPNQTYKDVLTFNKGDAVDADQNTITVKNILRQIGGEYYLLSGIPVSWLDTATYPVHIDPTVTLQPGATGYDSYGQEDNPTENYGTANVVVCGTQSSNDRAFWIKFDLSSITDFAQIISGDLTLYHTSNNGIDTGNYVYFSRLRRNWAETSVAWNYWSGTNAWTSPPGLNTTTDRYSNISGERFFLAAGSCVSDYHTAPLDTSVDSFLSGAVANYGWIATFNAGEASDAQYFASSDHLTAAWRPELEIEYIAFGTRPIFIT